MPSLTKLSYCNYRMLAARRVRLIIARKRLEIAGGEKDWEPQQLAVFQEKLS